jgi:hypothetical protein
MPVRIFCLFAWPPMRGMAARVAPTRFLTHGGCMDLAMAMGIALFGMFAGSTVLFFYQLAR